VNPGLPTLAPTAPAIRLEFWHVGGPRNERYVLACAYAAAHADPHLRGRAAQQGTYRWVLELDGETVASRGYSALFEEWQTTVTAQDGTQVMQMPESHTVPWVLGSRLKLQRRSRGGFVTLLEMSLPHSASVAPAIPPPIREWRAIHGDRGPTFLLVAEGYAQEDRDCFFTHAATACRVLLKVEPFASRMDRIRVAALFVPCRISGIAAKLDPATDGSNFASAYGTFGMARYLVCNDQHALHRAVAGVPWNTLVVLANGTAYGGSGIYNAYACVAAAMDTEDFAYVLPHELGHSFGGLADEYFGKQVAYIVADEDPWEAWEPNVSALDAQGRVKWQDLLPQDTPVPTPWQHAEFCRISRYVTAQPANRDQIAGLLSVEPTLGRLGVFEGARYRANGMFRSEVDCRMFSKSATRFCAICQETLLGAIDATSP
jgi:hypothetical protein